MLRPFITLEKNKLFFLLFSLFFFLSSFNLNAFDLTITKIETGLDIKGEYNRAFDFLGDIAVTGAIEINKLYTFKTGFSIGGLQDGPEIKAFGSFHVIPMPDYGLVINLAYFYSGLPEYEAHSHSILPYVSYNFKWGGFSLGVNFRFNSFFGESPLMETMFSASVHYNFIDNDMFTAGVKLANFYDFYVGNFGSYSIGLNGRLTINKNWSILSEIQLFQSGSVGLSSTFYGITFSGGFRYLW